MLPAKCVLFKKPPMKGMTRLLAMMLALLVCTLPTLTQYTPTDVMADFAHDTNVIVDTVIWPTGFHFTAKASASNRRFCCILFHKNFFKKAVSLHPSAVYI